MKALFVLHEGIGSTIFNSQVLEHAKAMKKLGIDFDILSYDTYKNTWELSQNNQTRFKKSNPDINIILKKAVNIYYPFSSFYNLLLLIIFFLRNRNIYSLIHARSDYTAFLCILAKPFHSLPVYWDCRGDAVDELKDSLSRQNPIVKLIGNLYLVTFDRILAYINCKKSDGAIFVSEALFNLFKPILNTKNYQIIPCPVAESKFFFDSSLRTQMRDKLNIKPGDTIFIYSGSMIAYQSLQEHYDLYVKLLQNERYVIIIATSDPDVAKSFFKDILSHRLIIISVSFDEINAYYNVSDFAFLIREKKRLNYVASPTKFGEYCLAGLPVIMNNTVNQAYIVAKQLNSYVYYKDEEFSPFANSKRKEVSEKAQDFYSRRMLNHKYIKLYNYTPNN